MAYLDLPIAPNTAVANVVQAEVHLYGSSRLGIYNINRTVTNLTLANHNTVITFTRGNKFFELSNHLGNVLVTVSDKKMGVDNNSDGIIDYYNADVVTANDYYPFGSQMPGRKYNSGSYRYGFNGQENDNSTGEGNLDFGARIMDVRLGRWLSVDPLESKFPNMSPYTSFNNNPLRFVDFDGRAPNDIIITGSSIYRQKAFSHIQKLTSTQLAMLPSGKVVVAASLKQTPFIDYTITKGNVELEPLSTNVTSKPTGTDLVSDLIKSTHITKVQEVTGGNSTTPNNNTKASDGTGTGSTVNYDANGTGSGIVNQDGTTGRPSQVGLGHEFGHALWMTKGKIDNTININKTDPDTGRKGTLTKEEIRNRKVDSKLRKEQKTVERMQPF